MSVTAQRTTLRVGKVGERLLRDDAIPKVRGDFAYSSDLSAPGMLWGDTLRERRRDVDRADARVGVGASQRVAPEHPGGGEVARVGDVAPHLRDRVVS